MLFNLLAMLFDGETPGTGTEGGGTTTTPDPTQQILTYVIIGVFLVFMVVWFVLSIRKRKKQEKEAKDLVDAVKPGNKVKTIGGICGIVVEVDNEENTFVLETGTEQSGKSYLKFDRQAIYQTDAVVEKPDSKKTEKTEEPAETAAEALPESSATEATGEQAVSVVEEPAEEKEDKKSKKDKQEKQIKF